MQRHVEHKFRNAFTIGLIALLVISLALVAGRGINTMAIYDDKGELLSAGTGIGVGFMIIITIASILFVIFTLDFIIAENKFNENDEKKLRTI